MNQVLTSILDCARLENSGNCTTQMHGKEKVSVTVFTESCRWLQGSSNVRRNWSWSSPPNTGKLSVSRDGYPPLSDRKRMQKHEAEWYRVRNKNPKDILRL